MQAARRLLAATPRLAANTADALLATPAGTAQAAAPAAAKQLTSLQRWFNPDCGGGGGDDGLLDCYGNGCMTLQLPYSLEDLRLCAVPKKKVSKHRRGMRNASKFIRYVPVVSQCAACGRVMHQMAVPSDCKQPDCPAYPRPAAAKAAAEAAAKAGAADQAGA